MLAHTEHDALKTPRCPCNVYKATIRSKSVYPTSGATRMPLLLSVFSEMALSSHRKSPPSCIEATFMHTTSETPKYLKLHVCGARVLGWYLSSSILQYVESQRRRMLT